MKNKALIISLTLLSILFGIANDVQAQTSNNKKDRVEILYFHGKQRCITCKAIENLTKEVVNTHFSKQQKEGKIVVKTIDISLKENEKLAEKYEVAWSSLFINKWKNGKETVGNLTEFGFTYAKSAPQKFKDGVKKKIEEQLK